MNKYKFIDNGNIERYVKKYIIHNGKQISYPSDELLLEAGIKDLIVEPKPEFDCSVNMLEPYYEDTPTHILKKWNVVPIPEELLDIMRSEDVIDDE